MALGPSVAFLAGLSDELLNGPACVEGMDVAGDAFLASAWDYSKQFSSSSEMAITCVY